LIAFRQIHKVLGMDPLPPPKFTRGRFNRKRRRDNSSGEGNDSEGKHVNYAVIIFVCVFYTYLKLLRLSNAVFLKLMAIADHFIGSRCVQTIFIKCPAPKIACN
jgi:hypothetical protein